MRRFGARSAVYCILRLSIFSSMYLELFLAKIEVSFN